MDIFSILNLIGGFTTGLGVTAVIQSSSATTVMVVGFVNSGLMTLRQAINVIMGANVGTTVTAWILSLSGISSDNVFVKLLKPSSFTPILALIGIILYMFTKESKKRDTGMILLGVIFRSSRICLLRLQIPCLEYWQERF